MLVCIVDFGVHRAQSYFYLIVFMHETYEWQKFGKYGSMVVLQSDSLCTDKTSILISFVVKLCYESCYIDHRLYQ